VRGFFPSIKKGGKLKLAGRSEEPPYWCCFVVYLLELLIPALARLCQVSQLLRGTEITQPPWNL